MNYANPELRDRLAAEYVLGTLHGAARQRFERLMVIHPFLKEDVHHWENRLVPMITRLQGVEPPKRVWRAIQRRIDGQQSRRRPTLFWPVTALASTAAAVVLAVLLITAPQSSPPLVGVIANANGQPQWALTTASTGHRLRIQAVSPKAVASNKSLELWLLPKEKGAAPVSLGLLPSNGERTVDLSTAGGTTEIALAVSLEPAGGSPTGLPTGPIVYQTRLVRM